MADICRIPRLLLKLYVVAYVSFMVPLHLQGGLGTDCCRHATAELESHDGGVSNSHDHTRCQICLTGGALHTIPMYAAISADSLLVERRAIHNEQYHGDLARQSTQSRAPPVFS